MMITLAALAGLWQSDCLQSQIQSRQGHVVESYTFSEKGEYTFERRWYSDSKCTKAKGDPEKESGELELGAESTDSFAMRPVREASFFRNRTSERGLLSVHAEGGAEPDLRVARGTPGSSQRNTMLGLFAYRKVKNRK